MSGAAQAQPVLHSILKPLAGSTLSPGPWLSRDDGTVIAADGEYVCVMGCPEEGLNEQAITNGAAVLALPELLAAAMRAERFMAGFEGDPLQEGLDSDLTLLRAAIAKAEGRS